MEPSALVRTLARHRRRRRLAALLAGFGGAAVVAGLALPLLAWSDAGLRPATGWRWAAWAAALALASGAAGVLGRGLFAPLPDVAVAGDLDRRCGTAGGLLATGASFAIAPPRDASPWMVGRTVALAAQAAAGITDWRRISPMPRGWPITGAAMLATLLIAGLIPSLNPWLVRAAWPGSAVGRPGTLRIDTWPGDGPVVAGAEPLLGASLSGDARRVLASVAWDDGRDEERLLEPDPARPGTWTLTLPPVTCGLTWQVRADREGDGNWDGEADRHRLVLAPGFTPGEVLIQVIPPSYSGLPAQTFAGDATALAGSTATIEAAVADGGPHLVAATVIVEPEDGSTGREVPATVSGRTLRAQLPLRTSVRWGLRLIAAGGREELPDRRWRIAVAADLPPAIRLESVPENLAADAADLVGVIAEDDVGLAATGLDIHRDHPAGPLLATIDLSGDARQRRSALTLDAAALGAAPGDVLALVATASDRAGQAARSAPALVTVAGDGSDADRRLAALLAAAQGDLAKARAKLPALALAWDRSAQDRRLVNGRIAAWAEELTVAATPWPGNADSPAEAEARAALADVRRWATAVATDPADPNVLAEGLAQLAGVIDTHARRADVAAAARAADAHARAAERHARALSADLAWGARSAWGLTASFAKDADGAPVVGTAVELPLCDNRDFPGVGRSDVRAIYRGLLRVPRAGATLTVTADDGVRLQVDGAQVLPAEAWGNHAPTPWTTPPLSLGWHVIELAYRQGGGGSFLAVAWDDGTPLTLADVRASGAPGDLARTDTSAIDSRTRALDAALERLAGSEAPSAPRIAARRAAGAAWTPEALTAAVAEARAVADELAAIRPPEPPRARSEVPPVIADAPRSDALVAGAKRAREDLAQSAAALALDLRETGEIQAAEDVERIDPANGTPAAIAADARTTAGRIASGAGARSAGAGLADPAREAGARRLATAIERFTVTAARLERIAARPQTAPLAGQAVKIQPPEAETDAGFARSRLTPTAISDTGIEAFRPDQQRAIRQYLDRLRDERGEQR